MAYNVLKGTVEGSVDQHGDQEIEGKKIFKNTISASVFYDTDAQSPCATMKDLAITKVEGATMGALLTFQSTGVVRSYHNVTYNGAQLRAPSIHGDKITGNASGITNVPHDQFVSQIEAKHINHGYGIHNVRGTLQVKAGKGLIASRDGIETLIAPMSGLSHEGDALCLDIARSHAVNEEGQNLSDKDLLLVTDVSRAELRNTTLTNFYENYIEHKIPQAAGPPNAIQYKSNRAFGANRDFTYDPNKKELNVQGSITSNVVRVRDTLICEGGVTQSIKKINSSEYGVLASDYTLLCDAYESPVTITLPPACNNTGRVIIIKKTNTDKYNLRSYPVVITVSEGNIDMGDRVALKTNYSSRTFQSDGNSWWIIGSKGL